MSANEYLIDASKLKETPREPVTTTIAASLVGSDMAKIQVFVDCEPFSLFALLGLSRVQAE